MSQTFLKSIGTATDPLNNDWLTEPWRHLPNRTDLLDSVRFPKNKRPTGICIGDKLVFYAAGWERFFGVAIVTSDAPFESIAPGQERWPWVLNVEVPLIVPRLELAPHISLINVANTSVRQQSHIRLSAEQDDLARQALLSRVRW